MNRMKFMLAAVSVCALLAACAKRDSNAITGSTDYTSVALSSDPSAFVLHVHLVPRAIDTTDAGIDTVPAHEEPSDSIAFDPVATLMPQGVVLSNGQNNMTYAFSNSAVASINESFFVQGDTTGTTNLTVTYTDVNHDFATTSLVLPVTVTQVP